MTYQLTIIIGNVTADPNFRYTPTGIAVADFSVAVNEVYGKGENRKENTTFFKVTVWRERAEVVSQYVKKGMKIMVSGKVKAHGYKTKQGEIAASLELTADEFKFLGGGREKDTAPAQQAATVPDNDPGGEYPDDVSDIPF